MPTVPLPYLRQFEIAEGVEVNASVTSSAGEKQTINLRAYDMNVAPAATIRKNRYTSAWLCPGELGPRFEKRPDCLDLTIAAVSGSTTLNLSLPAGHLYPREAFLHPGEPYHVCASRASGTEFTKADTLCSGTFKPHRPLLFYENDPTQSPSPYAVLRNSVVVFGVLDPALLTEIGQVNSSWWNTNANLDTGIEIPAIEQCLAQAMQTCDADPACHGKPRVLLAQMPLAKAERLTAHAPEERPFEAIIAQADEADATRDLISTDSGLADKLRPALLVPAPNFSGADPKHLRVTLQRATFTHAPDSRTVSNGITRTTTPIRATVFSGAEPLWKLIVDAQLAPGPIKAAGHGRPQFTNTVVDGILTAVRSACKSDVAFLQERDLFIPAVYALEQPLPAQLQELLDRLLWKGDFLSCRGATSEVLKQVIQDSDRFDIADRDELSLDMEYGRGLHKLGVFESPDTKDLIVDGTTVRPGQLYAVGTTEFLALGDTGYSELHAPPVPPAARIRSLAELNEISAIVCQAIARGLPETERNAVTCRHAIDADSYFDHITMEPYSNPKALNLGQKAGNSADENWGNRNTFAPIATDKAEVKAQNRRVESVRLDKADIGFDETLHSLSESLQKTRFGGVQAPEPTAPERIHATLDWLLRWSSYGKNVDRFFQSDAAYDATVLRQVFTTVGPNGTFITLPNEPWLLSQSKNTVGLESGFTWRLMPEHQKNVTGLKLLTSARFETQLISPFIQFQASDGLLKEDLPRTNSLFGKAGLRYDGTKSWIEAGLQSGPFTQISSLQLGNLTCDPGNIVNCVSPDGGLTILPLSAIQNQPFRVQTNRREQSGVFLNARIHLPLLLEKFDYVIDNSGSLFFNRAGDSSADTRYLETMTHSVTIPVIGNLSLVPKVELFFFQNKVAGWHIHGYQTSITAQYRFDWHTGLTWREAFHFPNAAPPSGH
ncbi:MAG: hypothetical protein JO061_20190 [Acidobacteriaceae bacterium]|nr:hypothetical protein [Acidobacteriaceae bacterium]